MAQKETFYDFEHKHGTQNFGLMTHSKASLNVTLGKI